MSVISWSKGVPIGLHVEKKEVARCCFCFVISQFLEMNLRQTNEASYRYSTQPRNIFKSKNATECGESPWSTGGILV